MRQSYCNKCHLLLKSRVRVDVKIHNKLFRILYYNLETCRTFLNLKIIISFIKHGC